jgi:hypothetical protein
MLVELLFHTGPGGGYSGGSGYGTAPIRIGNGGGSYNGGSNQLNTAASNTGNGQVQIALGRGDIYSSSWCRS